MTKTPTVDIVIAGKNEARHLAECLESLKNQNYPSDCINVIFVDDASTDNSAEIAGRHQAKVLRGDGSGPGKARNAGIASGCGTLVGFLDAHCVLDPGWVRAMVEPFDDDNVGGCMGALKSLADDARVQAYIDDIEQLTEERRLEDTLSGERNIYPWILSGNSVFRRSALEHIGGFADTLMACEDVDISWRIVLAGYQLAYAPAAKAVHYEGRPWPSYLYKGLRYGAGAAEIAYRFHSHGAAQIMRPHKVAGKVAAETVSRLSYVAGWISRSTSITLRPGSRPAPVPATPALALTRTAIRWDDRTFARISDTTIYWVRPNREECSVVVHIPSHSRFVLAGAGHWMWSGIVSGRRRDEIVEDLAGRYGIAVVTARADLDDFVQELSAAGVIIFSE